MGSEGSHRVGSQMVVGDDIIRPAQAGSTRAENLENPVFAGAIGSCDVQRAVGAEYRRPQPSEVLIEFRSGCLADERAVFGELEDLEILLLQHRHRQTTIPCPPILAVKEHCSAGRDGRESRSPLGHDGVGKGVEVGHGHLLVVRRGRVPAVVASGDNEVDLIVVVRAVPNHPDLFGVGTEREPLRVAVAVAVNGGLLRRIVGIAERVVWSATARLRVHPQDLACQRVQVLGCTCNLAVACGNPQVTVRAKQYPAAAVPSVALEVNPADQRVIDAGSAAIGLVHSPRNHLHFCPVFLCLAGVEAPVVVEVGINGKAHQPDREAGV